MVISVIAGASTMTALNGPSTGASGWPRYRKQGKTRTLTPLSRSSATPSSFSDRPSSLDLGDPLVGHVLEPHRGVEGEPGQDRHLRRRVGAADVVGRVRLGVAELLGADQHVGVVGAGRRHLAEDEVGGPVDDPEDLGDLARREALLDHADNRHHPGDRGLEAKLDPGRAGGVEQLVAVLGDQLLVGGDHVAALAQGAQHVVAGRVGAADQLDQDLRVGEDRLEVAVGPAEDAADLRAAPCSRLDLGRAVGEQRREGPADGPPPQDAYPGRFTHLLP
jgi:hypothetical protein